MINSAKVMACVWYNENVESAHGIKKQDFTFEGEKTHESYVSHGPLSMYTEICGKSLRRNLMYIEKGPAEPHLALLFIFNNMRFKIRVLFFSPMGGLRILRITHACCYFLLVNHISKCLLNAMELL